jgi:hypothetical protein
VSRYTEHNVEQGTEEWHALRRGRLTSSRAADSQRWVKSGESKLRRNLRVKLAVERITGAHADPASWSSKPMERGHELEPVAIAAYEAIMGTMVERVGFLSFGGIMAGASPDGMVDGGMVEVKNPLMATHYEYLKHGIPGDYLVQCQHLLWITGLPWCDWVSHHAGFPPEIQTTIVRVSNNADVDAYGAKALEFLGEVDVEEQKVREMAYGKVTA